MSEVSKMVCYTIVACLDPAHSKLIGTAFPQNLVFFVEISLISAKTMHLSAYCAQDLDVLQ